MCKKEFTVEVKIPSIDIYDKKYTMFTDIASEWFSADNADTPSGRYETFGVDLATVLSIANSDKPRRVWTAIDGDGGFYLVNGYHLVNRVYYEITNEEGDEEEIYLITEYDENGEVSEFTAWEKFEEFVGDAVFSLCVVTTDNLANFYEHYENCNTLEDNYKKLQQMIMQGDV